VRTVCVCAWFPRELTGHWNTWLAVVCLPLSLIAQVDLTYIGQLNTELSQRKLAFWGSSRVQQ